MELLAAKSIHFNDKNNQLSVLFCLFSQVEMKHFISLSHAHPFQTHTHTKHTTPDLWRWRRRSADTTPPCGCCSTRPSSTRNCGTSPLRRRQETTLWCCRSFRWTTWTLSNCSSGSPCVLGKALLHYVCSLTEKWNTLKELINFAKRQ